LALIAQNDSAFLEGLLELPWVRDDISSDEAVAIQEIVKLRSDTTQSLLENTWFLDNLTLAEPTLISRLGTISGVHQFPWRRFCGITLGTEEQN
jgi:hypothetical protein